jgi:hypothetical protein
MLQRKQTIWLLLAAVFAFLFTQVPLYSATTATNEVIKFIATESLLLFAVAIAVGLIAVTAIFLFKNRPTQLKLTFLGLLASVGLIALEVWQIDVFKANKAATSASYSWGSLLPIAMVVLFIMAYSGIRKDQKLIKSLDRLR